MIEHHIQKQIVRKLMTEQSLKFGELQPEGTENKLFNYHLKITIRDGMVNKSDDGLYSLSAEGRRTWLRVSKDPNWLASTAHSVLLLAIRRRSDGAWLLYERLTHPLLGKTGFMHATPNYQSEITQLAASDVLDKTGVACDFTVLGNGYFTFYSEGELESYTHFNLLISDDAHGEITQNDPNAKFFWEPNPDFNSPNMIANMATLSELYLKGDPFFIEETFRS